MGIQFDPVNKYILITSPTTEVTALELYNASMDWCDDQPMMGYDVPMSAVGKFDMGGGVYSDSIFLLINGWKLKPWSGTYTLILYGTLIAEPGESRWVPPDSGNVALEFQVSSQGTLVETGVSGLTEEEKQRLMEIQEIKTKTEPLPADPASQSSLETHVTQEVEELEQLSAKEATLEGIKGAGWTIETLKLIKELVETIESSPAPNPPHSIAQQIERKSTP